MEIMSDVELAALQNRIEERGELVFPISQHEAVVMKQVLDTPNSGMKGSAAKYLSKLGSEYYEGYRNVLYFIESLEKDSVEISVAEKGLMVKKKLNK